MNQSRIIILSVLLMSIGFAAQSLCDELSQSVVPDSIYFKKVPEELTEEISTAVKAIERRSPLTPNEAKKASEVVRSYNIGWGLSNDKVQDYVRKAGIKVVPVIAKLLSDKNEDTQKKALASLGYLRKSKEQFDANYKDLEIPVLILTERSSHDKSRQIRVHALLIMAGLALERLKCGETESSSKIISRAIKTLQIAAASDPDKMVRLEANTALEHLGFNPSPKPAN